MVERVGECDGGAVERVRKVLEGVVERMKERGGGDGQ